MDGERFTKSSTGLMIRLEDKMVYTAEEVLDNDGNLVRCNNGEPVYECDCMPLEDS